MASRGVLPVRKHAAQSLLRATESGCSEPQQKKCASPARVAKITAFLILQIQPQEKGEFEALTAGTAARWKTLRSAAGGGISAGKIVRRTVAGADGRYTASRYCHTNPDLPFSYSHKLTFTHGQSASMGHPTEREPSDQQAQT